MQKTAKVSVTVRKGRKIVKMGNVKFDQVVSRLIDLTLNAYAPMQARAALNQGEKYSYKDSGYNVTLTPLLNEQY